MSENGEIQMPKYRCHKEVWALKIKTIEYSTDKTEALHKISAVIIPEDDRYGRIAVDKQYLEKHKPQPGGYYVVYKDGYESWSPAEAFEDGYTLITDDEWRNGNSELEIAQPGTCRDCKHWKEGGTEREGWGVCKLEYFDGFDASGFEPATIYEYDDHYTPEFHTGPQFGCVKFERKT